MPVHFVTGHEIQILGHIKNFILTQHSLWSELFCLTKKLEGSRHYVDVFSNLTLFWHRVPTYDSDRKWRHTSPWKTTGWQDVESTGSKENKQKESQLLLFTSVDGIPCYFRSKPHLSTFSSF